MNRSRRRCVGLIVGLLTVVASTMYAAPSAAAAEVCTLTTPNVHISTHSGGTRMNFVPYVKCTKPAKELLDLNTQVQIKVDGSWVTTSGWTLSQLEASPTYVKYSISHSCSALAAKYRGRARYNYDGAWSAWKYSGVTTLSCPSSGGGGGGGGGGSWSVPANPE